MLLFYSDCGDVRYHLGTCNAEGCRTRAPCAPVSRAVERFHRRSYELLRLVSGAGTCTDRRAWMARFNREWATHSVTGSLGRILDRDDYQVLSSDYRGYFFPLDRMLTQVAAPAGAIR